eukprot:gnl/TRDRNA2_/TRDRNA2_81251_c0_seq2.p1 gnl/TRDRNA2_/TRDRNA2_81251_c0~~gnl/TRDRNA2_/TRDRNA2_81251_c0_seq2.p1  ORF type:complete len:133 (+),score=20.79 gnl/TRDRNA2_/TRDRNA2_81251_c0_seq2:36-401(+)
MCALRAAPAAGRLWQAAAAPVRRASSGRVPDADFVDAVEGASAAGADAGAKIAKIAAGTCAVFGLLGFHSIIIGERDRKERELRQRIEDLHTEARELKEQLREAERARFQGPGHRTSERKS